MKELRKRLGLLAGASAIVGMSAACSLEDVNGTTAARNRALQATIAAGAAGRTPSPALTPAAAEQTRTAQLATQATTTPSQSGAEASRVVEVRNGAGVRFPVPGDFRPESNDPNKVDNFLLERAPRGRWFHPMTQVRFMRNMEHVWSYQYYFANNSEGLTLVQHGGEEGKMFFRQENNASRLVLGVGILDTFTDSRGVRKDLTGDINTGFSADKVPSIWIRTHPNVQVRVYNADTGEALLDASGKPVALNASESGDVGFGLGKRPGRWTFEADIPVDIGLETQVWKGVHDRNHLNINWLDLSGPTIQSSAPAGVPAGAK